MTDKELEAIREKYKNGVPKEVIERIADKIADELLPQDTEVKLEVPISMFHRGKRE